MAQAIRGGWDISDAKRGEIADQIAELVTDPTTPKRTMLTAVKVLIAIEKANREQQAADKAAGVGTGKRVVFILPHNGRD